jgi:nucleoside-diphosphate-sugar epimerase
MKAASVVGLGKLGAPLAACLAAKGMRVYGVDTDPRKVEAIRQGQAPIFEPGLPWKEFLDLTATDWARPDSPRIVVDCWRVLKYLAHVNGVRYLCLGNGSAVQLAAAFVALSSRAD